MHNGNGTLAMPFTISHPCQLHHSLAYQTMVSPYDARCTAHTPVCNDNPRYMVLPYGSHDPHTVSLYRSQQPDHATANMAHAADPEDPWSNKEAMAHLAKQLTACKLEKQMFPDYNMVS